MMAWVIGIFVFALVHFIGVVAGVLLVNHERNKAIAASVVALLIAALAVHFAQVATDLGSTVKRNEADDLR